VIIEISEKMLGATAVSQKGRVVGIVTDGDIRRMLNKYDNINGLVAKDIMTPDPKSVEVDVLAVNALKLMQEKNISQLLAFDGPTYSGVVHLHNLINEGILQWQKKTREIRMTCPFWAIWRSCGGIASAPPWL